MTTRNNRPAHPSYLSRILLVLMVSLLMAGYCTADTAPANGNDTPAASTDQGSQESSPDPTAEVPAPAETATPVETPVADEATPQNSQQQNPEDLPPQPDQNQQQDP